jgi:hypothetical protein
MAYPALRWALLLTVGVLGQALTYVIYPFAVLYFRLFIKKGHSGL